MKSGLYSRRWICALIAAASLAVAGCSSPEEKAQRFYQHGAELLKQGDIAKAQLEFRNALQINEKLVPALYGMAEIAERQSHWDQLYALLSKVVELDPKHLQAQLKLGRLLLAADQLDKAMAVGDTVKALAPEDPNVLAFRAALLYKLGNSKDAVDLANAALAKDPHHIDALVVLATERIAAGDPQKGIEYLDIGIKENERNVALQLIKVQALEKLAKLDSAADIFRRLIELYPNQKAFQSVLAQFYLAHDLKDQAEAEYRAIAAKYPNDAQAKLDVVRFMLATHGPKAAVDELQKLISSDPDSYEPRFALANLYQEQNDSKDADAVFQDIIAKAGDKPEALRAKGLLAASLLTQGNKAETEKLVKEILDKDARNEQGLVLRAGMAIDERRLEDAIGDLRTVLRDVPNSARALALLARAHELSGSRDLADDYYSHAFQASKQAAPYGMSYAAFLMKQGKPTQAEGVLQDVLKTTPNYAPAMRLLVQSYLNTGNLVGAQAVAEKAKSLDDKGVLSNQIQGAVFAAQKNYENSISAFKRAYDSSPSDIQPMVALIRTYLRANKPKEALNFMNSVVQASPDNIGALLLQGQLLAMNGQKDQARKVYEQVTAREPKNVVGYASLVGLLAGDKRFDEADRVIEQGLAAVPGDFSLRLLRAGILESSGKIDDTIALYKTLLQERPGSLVIVNNLASLLAEYRTDAESLKLAHDLAQQLKGSDVPQFKDTLGWANYKVGNYKEAASWLSSAASQLPDMSVVQYHRGMNELALADKTAAREALRKAIDLAANQPFPQLDDAKKTLQGL